MAACRSCHSTLNARIEPSAPAERRAGQRHRTIRHSSRCRGRPRNAGGTGAHRGGLRRMSAPAGQLEHEPATTQPTTRVQPRPASERGCVLSCCAGVRLVSGPARSAPSLGGMKSEGPYGAARGNVLAFCTEEALPDTTDAHRHRDELPALVGPGHRIAVDP